MLGSKGLGEHSRLGTMGNEVPLAMASEKSPSLHRGGSLWWYHVLTYFGQHKHFSFPRES